MNPHWRDQLFLFLVMSACALSLWWVLMYGRP